MKIEVENMNPPHDHKTGQTLLDKIIALLVKFALRIRYRITVRGLGEIKSRGNNGILFLSNHPALIDPIIMLSILHKDFAPRSLVDHLPPP